MTTTFKNHYVDAYIEGRLEDIPVEHLAQAKDLARRRNPVETPSIVHPADAFPEQEQKTGWEEVD